MTNISLFTAIVLLGLCFFAANSKLTQLQDTQLFYNIFKDWTSKFNKQFGIEEMAVRFMNWKNNFDFVQEYNAQNLDLKLEMNDFADMSPEEFSALHLGLNPELKAKNPGLLGSNNFNDDDDYDNDDDDNDDSTFEDDEEGEASCNDDFLAANRSATNRSAANRSATNRSAANRSATNRSAANRSATNRSKGHANRSKVPTNRTAIPKSVDWRKEGAVAQVLNQGQCGGCWSFAAAGALEGLYAIKKNKLIPLSIQQMIDCSAEYGNMGCDGGLMTFAYTYTYYNGIQPAESYQYTASVNQCNQNVNKVLFKNKGYKEVAQNNSQALKAAVAKQPVSVGIEASSLTVQLFKSGVISTGCSTNLDHAVLIVGYDTAKNGQEYWIVKNSWGPAWGLNGYFHVAMGSQNHGAGVCGINMLASYPTL